MQYSTQTPFPRQAEFLSLDCEEAMFGGAAGPGKSSALLMAALQYAHIPGYAALILRRELTELEGLGGLLDRAIEWLVPQGVSYNASKHVFAFPSGAKLKFGGCPRVEDVYKYWGWEVQFLGIDEVTEFDEATYRTANRLLRRPKTGIKSRIPIRMRSATNPGGRGHLWVKKYFISKEATAALREGRSGTFYTVDEETGDKRAYVPSLLKDNPSVDAEAYIRRLRKLDPVTRDRLLKGDWSVREDSRIDPATMRYYHQNGEYYALLRTDGERLMVIHPRECERFQTIDTAGTSKDKARESKGKPYSWSVISTWDFHRPSGFLLFHKMRRGRWELPELLAQVKQSRAEDSPRTTFIENAHFGPAVKQLLEAERKANGVEMVSHDSEDKLTRAADFLNLCKDGYVYLPRGVPWVEEVENEWFAWTGEPDEQADIIDTASYAGRYVRRTGGGDFVVYMGSKR